MDEAFLEDCLAQGMSLPEIGELVGRPPGTVGYWVKRHGLVANGSVKFDPGRKVARDELEALLEAGMTLAQIAGRYGVASSTVRNWIASNGLGGTSGMRRIRRIRAARAAGERVIVLTCDKHGDGEHVINPVGVRCRRCNSEGVARRRRRVKDILVQEAGGCCAICGYDRVPRALHFHHLDPKDKEFGLARSGITRSIAATRAEMSKCVLLCSNCHCEVEEGLVEPPSLR